MRLGGWIEELGRGAAGCGGRQKKSTRIGGGLLDVRADGRTSPGREAVVQRKGGLPGIEQEMKHADRVYNWGQA